MCFNTLKTNVFKHNSIKLKTFLYNIHLFFVCIIFQFFPAVTKNVNKCYIKSKNSKIFSIIVGRFFIKTFLTGIIVFKNWKFKFLLQNVFYRNGNGKIRIAISFLVVIYYVRTRTNHYPAHHLISNQL